MSVTPNVTAQVDQQFDRIACMLEELKATLERIARAYESQAGAAAD